CRREAGRQAVVISFRQRRITEDGHAHDQRQAPGQPGSPAEAGGGSATRDTVRRDPRGPGGSPLGAECGFVPRAGGRPRRFLARRTEGSLVEQASLEGVREVKTALLDTGPIVAYLKADDTHHAWAVEAMGRLRPPLLTCEPVLAEAVYLLRGVSKGPSMVFEL